jgi:hypothetical protein
MFGSQMDSLSYSPTPNQIWLVRAALLNQPEALDAWNQWKTNIDFEALDPGSYRLLPLLYKNLTRYGIQDALLPKLKGIYRLTWCKNRLLFRALDTVLQALQAANIETLLLKGTVLTAHYYRDYGCRPMEDLDILVKPDKAPEALRIVRELGWHVKMGAPDAMNALKKTTWTPQDEQTERFLTCRHAAPLINASGQQIDLHWRSSSWCADARLDHDFWNNAMALQIGDVATLAFNATDQFLHTCIHAVTWTHIPPIRWLGDVMILLNSPDAVIDWDRVIYQAQKYRLVFLLHQVLEVLQTILPTPIPDAVMDTLQTLPISSYERMEYNTVTARMNSLRKLTMRYVVYNRLTEGLNPSEQPLSFLQYLQYWWDLPNLWQIPLESSKRLTKRFPNRLANF